MSIFRNYPKTIDALAEMKKNGEAVDSKAKAMGIEIDKISSQLPALTEGSAAYETQWANRQNLMITREIYVKTESDKILRQHAVLTKEIYREIKATVKAVAKAKGFEIVLSEDLSQLTSANSQELNAQIASRKVIYTSDKCDITGLVLVSLKQQYKAGK